MTPAGLPNKYVRLVYCLGYGETSLVEGDAGHNRGTPQFWKILSVAADMQRDRVLKRGEKNNLKRINNKNEVLKKLKRSGIWLQDASIVALYHKGAKPDQNVRETIISKCWKNYILPQIQAERQPRVIVVGDGIYQTLMRQQHHEVITGRIRQPQGCRKEGQFELNSGDSEECSD